MYDQEPPHLTARMRDFVIDDFGLIDDEAWRRAVGSGITVGTCRAKVGTTICGGHLVALRPYDVGKLRWYETECLDCQHASVAPGGRVLLKSGRASEQPPSMAARREKWAQLSKLGEGA